MLRFRQQWRFDSPGKVSDGVSDGFYDLVGKIGTQGNRRRVLEHFKYYFANAIGTSCYYSSDESWAETDLLSYMERAEENAPLFIEAFYDACEALRESGDYAVPDLKMINRILAQNAAGYEIKPPDLIVQRHPDQVSVSSESTSFDEQALSIIRQSLEESEHLLSQGKNRQAVQEILWLLETVSTVFEGVDVATGTIEGKYFSKITQDLRRLSRGQMLDQVLKWATTLYGYLSSPTGGGVRHGTRLQGAVELEAHEARLLCNLIRSYISFLLAEHERIISP